MPEFTLAAKGVGRGLTHFILAWPKLSWRNSLKRVTNRDHRCLSREQLLELFRSVPRKPRVYFGPFYRAVMTNGVTQQARDVIEGHIVIGLHQVLKRISVALRIANIVRRNQIA